LPAKTIFATPVFSMEKNRLFPPSGKNLPTLVICYVADAALL